MRVVCGAFCLGGGSWVRELFGIVLRCQKGQCGALARELYPRHEKQTKNPAERTGSRYIIEILMSRTQKLKGLVAASLRLKTFNDNPYLKFQSI